jgi:hypothetical protein
MHGCGGDTVSRGTLAKGHFGALFSLFHVEHKTTLPRIFLPKKVAASKKLYNLFLIPSL